MQDQSQKELLQFNKNLEQLRRAREKEVAAVKDSYDSRVQDTQRDGEDRLYQTKVSNDNLLRDELLHQEKRLNDYKNDFSEQRKIMEIQQENIVEHNKRNLNDIELNHRDKMQERMEYVSDVASDIDTKTDSAIAQMTSDAQRTIKNSHYMTAKDLDSKYRYNEKKLREEDQRFMRERGQLTKDHAQAMFQEKVQSQEQLEKLKNQNMIRQAQENQIFNDKIELERKHFDEVMKTKRMAYQQKMDAMIKSHEMALEHVKSRHAGEIQSLLESQAKYRKALDSRSDDPFYNVTALAPRLEDKMKFYEIKMEVPPFEQQNVILSGHERMLKLSHSRRAETSVELPDGSTNKSKRSESFVKEFNVADIIDPDKIIRQYDPETRLLTFRIDKA